MGNVSKIRDCYGCGICAVSCPRNIIDIHLNASGFYAPILFVDDKTLECLFFDASNDFNNLKRSTGYKRDQTAKPNGLPNNLGESSN